MRIATHGASGLALVLALFASGSALAADTPDKLTGATLVNAQKVKQLQDSGVPVIDTRVAAEYAEAHIKGATSVPYKEKSAKVPDFDPSQDSFDLSKLPADKNAPVVFYCNGSDCWKSFKASKTAIGAGYKKVQWYRDGFPDWKAKGLPTE